MVPLEGNQHLCATAHLRSSPKIHLSAIEPFYVQEDFIFSLLELSLAQLAKTLYFLCNAESPDALR